MLADEAALGAFEEGRLFGPTWLRALGALPNEYLHYYYFRRETLAAVRAAEQTRGAFLDAQQSTFFAEAHRQPERAFALWERTRLEREETYMAESRAASGGWERDTCDLDGGGYDQVALALMRALARDRPARLILNVRNSSGGPGAPLVLPRCWPTRWSRRCARWTVPGCGPWCRRSRWARRNWGWCSS
ncbi:hypothetical protein ACFQVA_11270 [Actinomadura keratinilytica]